MGGNVPPCLGQDVFVWLTLQKGLDGSEEGAAWRFACSCTSAWLPPLPALHPSSRRVSWQHFLTTALHKGPPAEVCFGALSWDSQAVSLCPAPPPSTPLLCPGRPSTLPGHAHSSRDTPTALGTRPQLPKESPRARSTLPTRLTAQPRPRPALTTCHSSGFHGVSLIVRRRAPCGDCQLHAVDGIPAAGSLFHVVLLYGSSA